jgi:predicted Zn finger-like uncharacterized protein
MHLGDNLQTTCLHCGSVFRISNEQLDMARGQARCSQCGQVFNALFSLENYAETVEPNEPTLSSGAIDHAPANPDDSEQTEKIIDNLSQPAVSLKEAMYGENQKQHRNIRPVLWFIGILLLIIVSIVQLVYYQRYALLSSSQYQQQILNLCQILPCDEQRFSSLSDIRLIERHVFSHPTRDKALMITGSFINQAAFDQALPGLLISLSDIHGNLIASRLFKPNEYLTQTRLKKLPSGKVVQFRLEIFDPGTKALTYEFEFVA